METGKHLAAIPPTHPAALACLAVFVLSYVFVLLEEKIHLRKSKPVMLGAGLIWLIIATVAPRYDIGRDTIHSAINHALGEYAALFLFLLAAMTYIAVLQERNVFDALRARLVKAGLDLRQFFWATGFLAFFLSPVADNLTTALIAGAVIMAVGRSNARFISLSCISAVNAANAGGAFSPFGDITTLMVWQAGHLGFIDLLTLFLPSLICFLVPASIMSVFVPKDMPDVPPEDITIKPCGILIVFLGLLTIVLTITGEQLLGVPAFLGMMTGLSFLMLTTWFIRNNRKSGEKEFDVMKLIASVELDTLLFFFGIIFSVGGLAFLGYLELASKAMYQDWGATPANLAIGFASAILDNIPVMFAILHMDPQMDKFQWLLVTLSAGTGGSLLSIGSAAGVALMGAARGHYTFLTHLKWTPVLLLGFGAAILSHFIINGNVFP